MLLPRHQPPGAEQTRIAWTVIARVFELAVVVSAVLVVVVIDGSHWLTMHSALTLAGVVSLRERVDSNQRQRLQSFSVVLWYWLLWLGTVYTHVDDSSVYRWPVGAFFSAMLLAVALASPWLPADISAPVHDVGLLLLFATLAFPTSFHAVVVTRPLSSSLRIAIAYLAFGVFDQLDHASVVDTRCLLVRVGWLFTVPPALLPVVVLVVANSVAVARTRRPTVSGRESPPTLPVVEDEVRRRRVESDVRVVVVNQPTSDQPPRPQPPPPTTPQRATGPMPARLPPNTDPLVAEFFQKVTGRPVAPSRQAMPMRFDLAN